MKTLQNLDSVFVKKTVMSVALTAIMLLASIFGIVANMPVHTSDMPLAKMNVHSVVKTWR